MTELLFATLQVFCDPSKPSGLSLTAHQFSDPSPDFFNQKSPSLRVMVSDGGTCRDPNRPRPGEN